MPLDLRSLAGALLPRKMVRRKCRAEAAHSWGVLGTCPGMEGR